MEKNTFQNLTTPSMLSNDNKERSSTDRTSCKHSPCAAIFPLRSSEFVSSARWCVALRFPWSNGPNNYRNDPVEVRSNPPKCRLKQHGSETFVNATESTILKIRIQLKNHCTWVIFKQNDEINTNSELIWGFIANGHITLNTQVLVRSEVKQGWARIVFRWETAWEYQVMLACK